MWRVALDLNNTEDLTKINGVWRFALGYIPGESNQGLVAGIAASPAHLADFDDSEWPICEDLRQRVSEGLTFAWWRLRFELPETLNGLPLAGSTMLFETNIDDYGEIWVDGDIDLREGTVAGYNRQQRVVVSRTVQPGEKHVIACLAANGPLGKPNGAVFIRYATLAFERSVQR